ISHFVRKTGLRLFISEGLIAVSTHHEPRKFTGLFHENAQVSQFTEVTDTGSTNPVIYPLLRCFKREFFSHDYSDFNSRISSMSCCTEASSVPSYSANSPPLFSCARNRPCLSTSTKYFS